MRLSLLVLFGLFAVACSPVRPTLSDEVTPFPSSTTTPVPAVTTPGTLPGRPIESTIVPATIPAVDDIPALIDDGVARAVRTPSGVIVAVLEDRGESYLVTTPCAGEAVVSGIAASGAHVVLDAGHGGVETGALGPQGTVEAHLNLAIAQQVQELLEGAGYTVVQTRTDDYRISIAARTAIVLALEPSVFVSIHHNADPDGPLEGPGSETYFQIDDPDSKRLAGLLYEEAVAGFSSFDVSWVGDTDAGAKFRRNDRGGNYYGILRRSEGVPAALTELAFLSNAPEEELLLTPVFQQAEALAIANGIVRYLTTDDPGSGFTEPYPRTVPAGPGGGVDNCEDPDFG